MNTKISEHTKNTIFSLLTIFIVILYLISIMNKGSLISYIASAFQGMLMSLGIYKIVYG